MEVTRIVVNRDHLLCGKHEFEHVKEFSYLGSQFNQINSANSEIQTRIFSGNRCYYAYGKLMKSRALNRSSKLKIYKSLIRTVVTYKFEAWTLTTRDEQCLRIFESRILRKIFGTVKNEDGSRRIRMNHELNEIIENADIVRFIKSRRIAWLGNVMRMDENRTPKRVLEWKTIGWRIRERPRKRWIEDVEEDIERMGIRVWRKLCKERTEWKRITEKAKTQQWVVTPVKEERRRNRSVVVQFPVVRIYLLIPKELPWYGDKSQNDSDISRVTKEGDGLQVSKEVFHTLNEHLQTTDRARSSGFGVTRRRNCSMQNLKCYGLYHSDSKMNRSFGTKLDMGFGIWNCFLRVRVTEYSYRRTSKVYLR